MKKIIAFVFACIFMLCAFVGIGIQLQTNKVSANFAAVENNAENENFTIQTLEETDPTKQAFEICVFGEASKNFTPDIANVRICVESLDLEKSVATSQNKECCEALISSLEAAGFERNNIVFEGTSCHQECTDRYSCENGFRVSTTFSIETTTEKLSKICQLTAENNSAKISYVNLSLSNQEEAYQQVLAQALENAKAKAKNIFKNENLQIASVKEEDIFYCKTLYRDFHNSNQNLSSLGEIKVEAKVSVNFQ